MIKIIQIAVFLLFSTSLLMGQEQKRNTELGITLLTVNPFTRHNSVGVGIPRIEYLNGIFFRYSKERISFRAFGSYAQYEETFTGASTFASMLDGWRGKLEHKNFKIGLGTQYALFKDHKWFYALADVAYNNIYYSGSVLGDTPNDQQYYSATVNGVNVNVGFGATISICKFFKVSPELTYSFFSGKENNNQTSLTSGQTTNNKINRSGAYPVIKLQASYLF